MSKLDSILVRTTLLTLFASYSIAGCQGEANPRIYSRGDIESTKSIGTLSTADIRTILDDNGVPALFELKYPVEILSVIYHTIDGKGAPAIVSGAFFVPQGTEEVSVLSLQHGTETSRNLVASVSPENSTEGFISLITASMGYATLVPDYLGFGASSVRHPYLIAESIVPGVVDFLRAWKNYASENQIRLNNRLFLAGYSEGGFVTLAAQKTIEQKFSEEFQLSGVAPMSGPYDLEGMVEQVFESVDYSTPAYIAYFMTAYDEYYVWNRLEDFFSSPYAAKMPTLFDGSKSWGQVVSQLPEELSELINAEFVSAVNSGAEEAFVAAIRENTKLDWTPQAPIHFFHGDADLVVPYQNALTAVERLTAAGAQGIRLTTFSGGNHDTSGPQAIIAAIQWFETISVP